MKKYKVWYGRVENQSPESVEATDFFDAVDKYLEQFCRHCDSGDEIVLHVFDTTASTDRSWRKFHCSVRHDWDIGELIPRLKHT